MFKKNQVKNFADGCNFVTSADCCIGSVCKNQITSWYNKYARAITIFILACILGVSSVMIAKVSTDFGSLEKITHDINKQITDNSIDQIIANAKDEINKQVLLKNNLKQDQQVEFDSIYSEIDNIFETIKSSPQKAFEQIMGFMTQDLANSIEDIFANVFGVSSDNGGTRGYTKINIYVAMSSGYFFGYLIVMQL